MSNKRATLNQSNSPVAALVGGTQQVDSQKNIKATKPQSVKTPNQQEDLERLTFYIKPKQDEVLNSIRTKLRRNKVKTNRSLLVRLALDLLSEKTIEEIADILSKR